MRFEYPHLLWLLLVAIPGMTAFLWWAWRKKKWLIAQFVQSRLLAQLTVGVSARRQKIKMTLVTAAIALLIIVLARPQWGFDWIEARQRGLDIVVAIDTSRSMLARDVAPNRLQRAKLAALDLVKLARTDRLGLVAFAGGAFLQCPLSVDDVAFRQSLDALNTSIIPQGGTALSEAIRTALGAFEKNEDNYKVLVLFTDGEDHDGHALDAAKDAAAEGLRIFTIGVGTTNGLMISIPNDQGGSDFVKDEQGHVIKSSLNSTLLEQIAQAASGFYQLLAGANTIDKLYADGLAPLPKSDSATRQIKRYHERYQWFLGLAFVLLLVEMFLRERRRVSRSETAPPNAAGQTMTKAAAVLLLVWGLAPGSAQASASRALKQYQAGNYEAARLQYEKLLEKRPDDARLHFNIGDAAYQSEAYDDALQHFQSSLVTKDLQLQQQAYYNMGNTAFRLGEKEGDPEKKIGAWEQSLTHYESALKLNPEDHDAQFNHDLVKKRLEEFKQQNQDNQQQNDKQNDESKDDQEQKDQKDQQDQKQNQDQQSQKDSSQQKQEQDQQKQQQQQQQQSGDQKDKQKSESQEGEKQESPDAQKQEQAKQGESKDQEEPEKAGQEGTPVQVMQMSMQEAKRLLDSMNNDERTLIFLPQNFTNRTSRVGKNW